MPFAQIKIIEGVFSEKEIQQILQKVTDALVAVEGESLREKTVVVIEEVRSGSWGIGGMALTTQAVQTLRAGSAPS